MVRWIEKGPAIIEHAVREPVNNGPDWYGTHAGETMVTIRYEYVNSEGARYDLTPYGAHTEPLDYVQPFMEPDRSLLSPRARMRDAIFD